MTNSKNILSMINLLFLLAVSVPQVLSANDCNNEQCNVVRDLWSVLGVEAGQENSGCSGVSRVTCSDGNVTVIDWSNIKLETTSETIRKLSNLIFKLALHLPRFKTL
jgi:hypothetical protein